MKNPFGNLRGGVAAWAALLAALPGCGGDNTAPAGSCVGGNGKGTLSIKITGTPSGIGSVSVGGTEPVATDTDISLAAGSYDVAAARVAEASTGIARTAYEPSVDEPVPCVRAGQTTTVNVTYAPIATSGRLWVGLGSAPSTATLLGYAAASVAATGTVAAEVAANTGGAGGFAFDRAGNLWVVDDSSPTDPPVLERYPAAALAASGDEIPDVIISSPSFGAGLPGAKALAFDPSGNLWVSVGAASKVVSFTPDQLAASGSPTASIEEPSIEDPAGLAFDAAGNLWVASGAGAKVLRIDALRLTSSGSSPDLTIIAQTPPPSVNPLPSPSGLAFDGEGNLWVNYNGTIAKLAAADLAGTGTMTLTPTIQLETDFLALPVGIAFDEQRGLWFAYGSGTFARLDPSQLGASGHVTPATIITSADVGAAGWFAIYPAPAFTPLWSRFF